MDDLISRQAAIDNLERYRELFSWDDGDRERAILSRVIKELQSMPSAQPRKGKWIYAGIRGRFPTCSCSVCGSKENADWAIMQGANFCPNCGADMRGDSDACNV